MLFRILHISDVHFGPNCNFQTAGRAAALSLVRDVSAKGFWNLSAIVISGDLTWSNEADEFRAGSDFIVALQDYFNLRPSNIVLVPGNHDIRWSENCPSSTEQFRYLFREKAERSYREFLAWMGRQTNGYLGDLKIFENDQVVIVGLNSCLLHEKQNAGLGFVGTGQIKAAIRSLRRNPIYVQHEHEFFKIAVLHHHVLPGEDLDVAQLKKPPAERRFSLTLDAKSVLEFLLADNFALILHGHLHVPLCSIEQRFQVDMDASHLPRNGHVAIAAAGSLSVDQNHCKRNQYQVIELDEEYILIHTFEKKHGSTTYEPMVPAVQIHRGLLTTPPARLELLLDGREQVQDYREILSRRNEESAILAELVLVQNDREAKEVLFELILPLCRRHPVLAGAAGTRLRELMEEVLSIAGQDPKALLRYEYRKRHDSTDFPEYILRLMAALHG